MITEKYEITEYIFDNLRPFVEHRICHVKDQKELLNVIWIKAASKKHPFARYSISEKQDCKYLMVENDNCTWWLVVAILPLEFPTTLCAFKSVLEKQMVEEDSTDMNDIKPKKKRKNDKDLLETNT